jgi:type I restriction enzyme S subunit
VSTILAECVLKSGTTFPQEAEQESGEVLYIKVSDMNLPGNEVYIRNSTKFVSVQTAGKTIIPAGAVIFPKRGAAIGTNKKRIITEDTCVDLNTMAVIPGKRIMTQYLYGFFNGLDLMSFADGSTIPQLNNRQVGPIEIIVPPLPLQEQFSIIFEQSDKSKLKLQNLLAELSAIKYTH